jgi:dihydrofolate synthase/folylpolyglutamate synthase
MEIINFTKKHKIFFEKHSITFFEATTAMAFDHFRKNNVDIAIVETGLGGRLDSTNVLTPIHTIITEIDFDHTHLLGETVEEITAEKCGIIKNETPNTTINTKKNIAAVISEFSTKQNTKTNYINKKNINLLEHNINKLHLVFQDEEYILPQSGSFQAQNAILAIEVIKKEFPNINHQKIQDGLNHWFWPGRMQQMKNNIFYDVAHNSSGVNILISDLYEIYRQKPLGLVVMKNDKIRPEIINLFESSFEELIISTIPSKDILSEEDISSISSLKKYQFINSLDDALRKIENKKFDGPKVIFGSHYIAKYIYDYFDFSFDKGHI